MSRRAAKKTRPVEGHPFWPHEVIRDSIIILLFTGLCFLLSGFMPYFLESPADYSSQPPVILPDWYLLWSYGMLKITADITVLGVPLSVPLMGENFGWQLLNAKTWGLLLNGVVAAPLILIVFLDRGNSKRPVEAPFWASAGMAGVVYIFMTSVYSINNVIYSEFPIFGQEYGTWLNKYVTLFQMDLLAWLTNLLTLLTFFVFYVPLKIVQKQHGYEAKLNANYYKVR